ncbi:MULTISPECIES: pyridoxal 5'-phosphate synthase glutaminase subunit PdxT [unclassified Streptomyces]|uniref:pyridoxal 5'-phosphate synthase glutaminase subunit PdxT n=1 Tax=unclassified Streptomyces TaxID=2593676 RepID=UPI002E0D2263|nr:MULTISPECIES: pyridoxal 5'-phosphate synthase glutaminase subunit PdxT [unclassified Streptomyces]WRZ10364.1 pyridoxal 5'-phosphate synthase glutaminase subunit PdxT [Streptomyces sp. NBC_00341]WSJ21433.1 pyridoxal 5'-phosphate synthase glutaminase subunit PdxT [Streptomyces sp. NBC_01324]
MSDTPVIGVLALQGDVREHLIALASADALARPVRRPEELAEVDGLVVPGGESTTMSKLAVLFGMLEPLRERVAAGMPVYGTCAGMILLADKILDPSPSSQLRSSRGYPISGQETIGGIDMIVRRNAFGRQNESFEAAVDVAGIEGGPVEGVFIRAPWVESVGARAQVVAEHGGHIVGVRQGNALATSFHPELTGDHRLHAYFVDMVRASG